MASRTRSGPPRTAWEVAYAIAGGAVGTAADTVGRVWRRDSLRARLGAGDPLPAEERPLWFHGASVGEVATLKPLVVETLRQQPGLSWGVTTTTTTGLAATSEPFRDARFRRLLPLDAWPATGRFLRRVHPGAVMIVETEIWPKLLLSLARARVPVCMASARMTAQSFGRYRRARPLFGAIFSSLHLIAARSEEDRERFVALGAAESRTVVLGNTKLDVDGSAEATFQTSAEERAYGRLLGGRHAVVWGCLRPGEEGLAFRVMADLSGRTDALWVLAPRHLTEFDAVAAKLTRNGIPFLRWSKRDAASGRPRVLLVDTLGDLRAFYARADVAVVGGTFARHGGHNLMEPAAFGVPVLFGPDTAAWPDDAARLEEGSGGLRVHGPGDLGNGLWHLLDDPDTRCKMGRAARRAADAGRGASRRIVDALAPTGFFEGVTRRGKWPAS